MIFYYSLVLIITVIFCDQATKWVILSEFSTSPRIIEVTSFFNILLVWNRGVSFSLFSSSHPYSPWILSAVALIVVVILLYWLKRTTHCLSSLALGFIIGGAIGNIIDRLRFQAVVDFLDFHLGDYHWPAFNVADMAITFGIALLLIDVWFVRKVSER
ncbi:MAG: signal peptidase II [Alphaproteobacteria bacterium]|nr:signal peptidase II [Alphaproteobacteria bacterium]